MAKNQNERGLKKNRKTTVSNSTPIGVNYILAIAIDKYQNFPILYNCVKDAKDLIEILTGKYQFESENVTTLFNEEATEENIFKNFRTLIQTIKPIDSLIIYFAGHGEFIQDFNEGYWVPVDSRDNSIGQYIPNSQIKTMLTAIKSQHTFLIADSCFSGSLFLRGNHRNVVRRRVERFASRWGLTSGRSEIVGDGQPGQNSPFALSILHLLENTKKGLSVQELCAHVTETVAANATQTPIGEPLNIQGHQGGQFVFHLKKNEERDWMIAKEKNTADSYESFVVMYPEGKYFLEAKTLFEKLKEEENWNLALQANTIQGFLMYKKKHPNGKHLDESFQKIEELEDEKEWAIISRQNRLAAYLKYIRNYPLGKHVDEAQKKIDLLDPQRKLDKGVAPIQDDAFEIPEEQPKVEEVVETLEVAKFVNIQPEAKKKIVTPQKKKDKIVEKEENKNPLPLPINQIVKYGVAAIALLFAVVWGMNKSSEASMPPVIAEEKWEIFQDEESEKYGLKKGDNIIHAIYDEVRNFENGFAAVKNSNGWGFVNEADKEIIPLEYESVGTFQNGKIDVQKDGKKYVINQDNECIENCDHLVKKDVTTDKPNINPEPNPPNTNTTNPIITSTTNTSSTVITAECKRFISNANVRYHQQKYQAALENYQKAKSQCSTINWVNLSACQAGISYMEDKITADKFFEEKKYQNAKDFYNKALVHRYNDSYAKRQIIKCDEKLSSTPVPNPVNPTVANNKPKVVIDFDRAMSSLGGATFKMGSESGSKDEQPIHNVKLSGFSISKYEVTQELWEAIMGNNPSAVKCKDCPVTNVSHSTVRTFIKKLNIETGKNYRLPSEAEWEYAALKGKIKKKSNIGEWCMDWYDDKYYEKSAGTNPKNLLKPSNSTRRVIRGSGFNKPDFRISNRESLGNSKSKKFVGFRLVR